MANRGRRRKGKQAGNGVGAEGAPANNGERVEQPRQPESGLGSVVLFAVAYDRSTGSLRVSTGDATPDEYLRVMSAIKADAERRILEAYKHGGR